MQNTDIILIAIAALIGLSVLMQAISLIAVAVVASKGVKAATAYADEFRSATLPVLQHSRDLLQTTQQIIQRLEPRLDSAANDLADMTRVAAEETRKIQVSAAEINERIRRQAERMDGMTTTALNGVDRMGHLLNMAVNLPVRQVSGVVAAAKAIVDTLRSPAPPRRRPAQDRSRESEASHIA